MEYRVLGRTGVRVSAIGLGVWQFSESWGVTRYEDAVKIVRAAYESGVNLYDTAIVYGNGMSEEYLGRALEELGIRDEVIIATKIPGQMLAEHDVFKATERSLRRLRVDTVDLMQVHWPPLWHNIPTCEYMRALERLVFMGKVRFIGLSDFPRELAEAAQSCLAREEIASMQLRYNLLEREVEKELLPYVEGRGMSLLAWSPLAKGALTGKYIEKPPRFDDVRASDPLFHEANFPAIVELNKLLIKIAEKYSKTPAQIALNWLITNSSAVIPIPGAKTPQQASQNAGAAGWRLSFEDWLALKEASDKIRITRVTY